MAITLAMNVSKRFILAIHQIAIYRNSSHHTVNMRLTHKHILQEPLLVKWPNQNISHDV